MVRARKAPEAVLALAVWLGNGLTIESEKAKDASPSPSSVRVLLSLGAVIREWGTHSSAVLQEAAL